MKEKGTVKVYLDWYYFSTEEDKYVWDGVNNIIAEFRSMNWAKDFIEKVKEQFKDNEMCKVRVEA